MLSRCRAGGNLVGTLREHRHELAFSSSMTKARSAVPAAGPAGASRGAVPYGPCPVGGRRADESACADGATIILLVSDINMPGMSGLDLLPRIKLERPDIPVFMVTAYGDENTRKLALERGADGCLTKPIDFGALRSVVQARLAA